MKQTLGILIIGFCFLQAFTIHNDELTKEERKAAAAYFKETRDYFTKHVKGLSQAQLDFKASPEKWSIRECIEHIALAESFIFTIVENLVKQPANPEKKSEINYTAEQIKTAVVDRAKKGQAPEPIKPHGEYKTAEEAVNAFLMAREQHIKYINTTKDDLRNHLSAHPFFGMLDAYDWLILLAGHSKRHTLQIEEIMASPGFPKTNITLPERSVKG